jgi:hypothetical protein
MAITVENGQSCGGASHHSGYVVANFLLLEPYLMSHFSGASSGGEGEDGEPHQMEDVPLKTEAPDYEDDEDEQASGADDGVEEQESIIAKIQKSDQLILTTSTSRSRASNSDHSLFGGNVMDMLSTSESGKIQV